MSYELGKDERIEGESKSKGVREHQNVESKGMVGKDTEGGRPSGIGLLIL